MSFFMVLLAAALSLSAPLTAAEFTVVTPASSTLVEGPQTGFSNLASTDPDEQKAVYEIMAATGNDWASSIPDVCRGRWHGIECMPDSNNVYHIVSLSFGALSDDTAFPTCDAEQPSLSPALLRLPHLRNLFVYRCLTSSPQPIPAFLSRLAPALRTLVLRDNGHVGAIPPELGNLTSLRVLDLHSNNLRSSIPASLTNLTQLQLLDLSSNHLTGPIPALILPNVNILDLSRNILSGNTPNTFTSCTSLIKLDLSKNQLTGPIPDSLVALQNLILLDMSHNRLTGELSSSLGLLTSLRELILKGNPMRSVIPSFLGLKNLNTLVLSDMGLEGEIPDGISELPSLRVLHLDGNRLNGTIPPSFGTMVKLSELRVNDNLLTGSVPFGREMVWRMGKKLRVYNNSGLCCDGDDLSGVVRCEVGASAAATGAGGGGGSGTVKHEEAVPGSPQTEVKSSGTRYGGKPVRRLVLISVMVMFAVSVL